jgi:hypothetical protein
MPMNFLLIDSLLKFQSYYGNEYEVEYPTNSGNMVSIKQAALSLAERLIKIFRTDENGKRPMYANYEKMQTDPHFKDLVLFYEYFHGDDGKGLGLLTKQVGQV